MQPRSVAFSSESSTSPAMFERKNHEVEEKVKNLFGGGNVSKQVVSAVTIHENVRMSMHPLVLKEKKFEIQEWLGLVVEW